MRRLLSRPSPNYDFLIRSFFSGIKFKSDMAFFKKGRDALIYGLELLDIKPNSIILVPAYMCDPTIAPLRERGYKLVFFDIEEDLSFNFEVLESLMKRLNVQAILAPHYFGFPSNIQDIVFLCKRYEVKVIEDCAHSFLTKIGDKSVGSFGDIAIFSMRKTLAVPDGGALKVNCQSTIFNYPTQYSGFYFQDISYLAQRILEFIIVKFARVNIYSNGFIGLRNSLTSLFSSNLKDSDVIHSDGFLNPSWLLKSYLSSAKYLEEISLTRSTNFQTLAENLENVGASVLFKEIPKGCVPQFFVVRDENDVLVSKFKKKCLGVTNWPGQELPFFVKANPKRFPNANKLNDTLLMLPLHQSTSRAQLDYMVKILVD